MSTTQAIRDALAAVHTPGPWAVYSHELPSYWCKPHKSNTIGMASVHPQLGAPFPVVAMAHGTAEVEGGPRQLFVSIRDADAAYIAACNPQAITALLAELDTARAGIEAAVLAERERCAALVESIAAERGIGSYEHGDDYAVGAVNALTRAAIEIREGVKS